MSNWKLLSGVAAASIMTAAIVAPAEAQVTTSSIRGNVTTDAGASMSDATVTITHTPSGTVASATTNANGDYLFEGLTPADGYRVFFADVDGKTFVDPNVGIDDTIDSDAIAENGGASTASFALAPGEDKRDLDAGG